MPLHNSFNAGNLGFVVLFVVIFAASWSYRTARSRAIVEDWVRRNNFELTNFKLPMFAYGPFFFRVSKGQSVARFEVRDRDGQLYRAWGRCGNYWVGLWSNDIEVIWDQPAPPAYRPVGDGAWS